MGKKNYREFCEDLFRKWLKGSDFLNGFEADFDVDYLPEPYLPLKSGRKTLYVLNYNPGHPLRNGKQSRKTIQAEYAGKSYAEVASGMVGYYLSEDFHSDEPNAYSRNQRMIAFAKKLGFDGVENLETFFLHSNMFDKKKFLCKYKDCPLAAGYAEALKDYLDDKIVMAINAVGSQRSISKETLREVPWIHYQAKIIGLDFEKAELYPLTTKDSGKVTSAILKCGKKIMVFMMGANNLPKIEKLPFSI